MRIYCYVQELDLVISVQAIMVVVVRGVRNEHYTIQRNKLLAFKNY
jgi:hypothetical protein